MPISKLKFWNKNPRKNQEAAKRLAVLIASFGFICPIIATPDFTVRAGHTRIKAAQAEGLKEVPVIFVDFPTEQEAEAFSLAENKSHEFSEWDFSGLADILSELDTGQFDVEQLTGFDRMELDNVAAWSGVANFAPEDEKNARGSAEWEDMPEFEQQNLKSWKRLVVHFATPEDYEAFARLIDQHLTGRTRYVWYPEVKRVPETDKRYVQGA